MAHASFVGRGPTSVRPQRDLFAKSHANNLASAGSLYLGVRMDEDLERYSNEPPDNREVHRALGRVDDMWMTHEDISQAAKLVASLAWLFEPIAFLAKNRWLIVSGAMVAGYLQHERIQAVLSFIAGLGG